MKIIPQEKEPQAAPKVAKASQIAKNSKKSEQSSESSKPEKTHYHCIQEDCPAYCKRYSDTYWRKTCKPKLHTMAKCTKPLGPCSWCDILEEKKKKMHVCEFSECQRSFTALDRLARHYAGFHKGNSPRKGMLLDFVKAKHGVLDFTKIPESASIENNPQPSVG